MAGPPIRQGRKPRMAARSMVTVLRPGEYHRVTSAMEKVGRHLDRPVGAARWAPMTTDGTFGPQVCPQRMPGDFAAAP